mmetsp:Transcript_29536/g.71969  ORF Transcript_29536/g.71969 Transcript_29536/m.71969 type:complete len:103 (+) Transcript_29536:1323-1631(+)
MEIKHSTFGLKLAERMNDPKGVELRGYFLLFFLFEYQNIVSLKLKVSLLRGDTILGPRFCYLHLMYSMENLNTKERQGKSGKYTPKSIFLLPDGKWSTIGAW